MSQKGMDPEGTVHPDSSLRAQIEQGHPHSLTHNIWFMCTTTSGFELATSWREREFHPSVPHPCQLDYHLGGRPLPSLSSKKRT